MTTASTPLAASNYVGSSGPRTVSSSGCSQGTLYNYLVRSSASSSVPTSNSLYPKIAARKTIGGGLGSGPFVRHFIGANAAKPSRAFRTTVDSDVQDGLSCTIFVGESLVDCSTWINQGWFSANNGSGSTTSLGPINQYTCDTANEAGCLKYNNQNYAQGFKSNHPGGAQFLFGDGSVHFIPETIDHVTYQYLGAMADGTPVRVPK